MKIRVGFELKYECAAFTPMILMLNVHPSRAIDLLAPDRLEFVPSRSMTPYLDGFGNKCVRVLAPPGELTITCNTIIADSGRPDPVDFAAPAPANWQENFVSSYATSHPWEDFAETWAHYLHIVDTLEMAGRDGHSSRVGP